MTYVEYLHEKGRNEGIVLGRNEGIVLGRNEGIVLGRNEGIEIGFEKGQEQLLRNMLHMGHAPETIAQLTGSSLAQILKVQATLAND